MQVELPKSTARSLIVHSRSGLKREMRQDLNANARAIRRARSHLRDAVRNGGDMVDVDAKHVATLSAFVRDRNREDWVAINGPLWDRIGRMCDEARAVLEEAGHW